MSAIELTPDERRDISVALSARADHMRAAATSVELNATGETDNGTAAFLRERADELDALAVKVDRG